MNGIQNHADGGIASVYDQHTYSFSPVGVPFVPEHLSDDAQACAERHR
jgi:hypothetical protein